MLADRYELHREIGRGGMGAVWLGHDTVLGRDVAIKQIGMAHGGGQPDLQRAEREAHLAARINHQNVVAVFDLVDDGGHQWLVMEYVEGTTLAALITERGSLDPDELAPLVRQVAGALAAAHAHSIVHRDVKPSNILLTHDGTAKLSDFGIARAHADASLTQTGLVTGSPAYLSPEVASGHTAGAPSDVWSLGATVFHALAGHPPYSVADNLMGAMYRIVHDEPPRLNTDGPLSALVTAMMQHDPGARPTMAAVEEKLSSIPESGDLPDDEATQTFQPFREPAEPTVDTAFRPLEPPVAPAPASTGTRALDRPRGSSTPIKVAGAVVALAAIAVLAFVVLGDEDDRAVDPPAASSTEPAPTESSPASTADGQVTAAALEGFVADYLMAASTDPDEGFTMLTPEFQNASNGIKGYKGFWGKVDDLDVEQVSANPEAMSVSYTYSYDFDGDRRSDAVTLKLVKSGDSFLIAGEV